VVVVVVTEAANPLVIGGTLGFFSKNAQPRRLWPEQCYSILACRSGECRCCRMHGKQ
jgi:hypothetical protein